MKNSRRFSLIAGVLAAFALGSNALGTDLAAYKPDKTGKTDVSGIVARALADAAKSDRVLAVPPGTYLLAKPVSFASHVSIIAPLGRAVFRGANRQTDLFRCGRNHGNVFRGLSFTNCRRAITCEGDGYFATADVIDCSFSNCASGVEFPCIQSVSFTRCRFSMCDYGVRGRRGYGGRSNLVIFTRCSFSRIREWGIEIEGSPTNIRDCNFEGCSGGGIHLLDAMVATVEGCYFEANAKTGHEDIRVSKARLHNGVVTIRDNQFNHCFCDDRISVSGPSGAHVYDNFVYLTAGQRLVANRSARADDVRVGEQYYETSGSIRNVSAEEAAKAADLVVKAKADVKLTGKTIGEFLSFAGDFRIVEKMGGKTAEPGKTVRVYFNLDKSPSRRKLLPLPGRPVVLYLRALRRKGEYRAFKIEGEK